MPEMALSEPFRIFRRPIGLSQTAMADSVAARLRYLALCWWNVADRSKQAMVIEPVDPLQGGKLHCFQVAP